MTSYLQKKSSQKMRFILFTILTVIFFNFTACTNRESAQTAGTKELKIGITQEFETLNPIMMTMMATHYIYYAVGRGLVSLDINNQWYPVLAKEIPSLDKGTAKFITEKGKKKIQATWNIQDNAKWSDGHDLTCADFAFSREVAANPNIPVGEKDGYTQVERIYWDSKTPKKCVFTYEKPRWDFYQLAKFFPLPKHLEESIYQKLSAQKDGYEKNTNYVKNPTLAGLYYGPYMISEVKLGDHITLTPNPYFWGAKPKFERVIIKLIPNSSTLEANLRSGTIDLIWSMGMPLDQAIAFEKKVAAESLPYQVLYKPSLSFEHVDMNQTDPILQDVRVRKALLYSIDREELTKALFESKQIPAVHFLSPKDPWFTDDSKLITTYNYDKEKAVHLLEQAGFKTGADGYRYRNGQKLTLTFASTAGNKSRETVQAYLQDKWKQVGIDIVIKNEPARVFFGESLKKNTYGSLGMYAFMSSPEESPKSFLHSRNIPSSENGFSGENYPRYHNAKVDALLDQLDLEFSSAKRQQIITTVLKYVTEDLPTLPLYYRSDVSVVPKNLRNFSLSGNQYVETNYIENWEMP